MTPISTLVMLHPVSCFLRLILQETAKLGMQLVFSFHLLPYPPVHISKAHYNGMK